MTNPTGSANVRLVRDKLSSQVPLIAHLGVDIVSYEPGRVVVEAPLAANINTHGTAFGGSLYCVGTLGGWSLVHLTLMDAGFTPEVWVTEGQIKYLRPVKTALRAEAVLPLERCQQLVDDFSRHKKAALEVPVQIQQDAGLAVTLSMSFAAR